jgi:hypothetical protein
VLSAGRIEVDDLVGGKTSRAGRSASSCASRAAPETHTAFNSPSARETLSRTASKVGTSPKIIVAIAS